MQTNMALPTLIKQLAFAAAAAMALGAATPAHALIINLTSTGNANADLGFRAAANYWQSVFIDPITVNITAGFAPLGSSTLGRAASSDIFTNFLAVKTALGADSTSADDATMVLGLPGGSSYGKYINGTTTNANAHLHSGVTDMQLTTANAKAIGLLAANATAEDAQITFSSNFSFDFDQTDGIGTGLFDFVGIAIHELGHAMGFVSGVDLLDAKDNFNKFSDTAFDRLATLLDFTRCSAASQAAGADMDWTADKRAKDFAIDGNCTALVSNAWSTGVNQGDGRQASHWKDGFGIGIMDPTAVPTGQLNVVTARDIQSLDVIGWTRVRVPEPGTLLLLVPALLGMSTMRRRWKAVSMKVASDSRISPLHLRESIQGVGG
ncbi:MAG: NF038122 family metalloprotease [Candidatus Accumulibacter sp.]|jgi:hypothetical protein|nr:NF038122 family metalloprotease [Accumulibacter sp.]